MAATDPNVPPEAQESDIKVKGTGFFGPTGKFGTKKNHGLFNVGATSIGKFVEANANLFSGLSPSLTRVMRAVSANEGMLGRQQLRTMAFMSFGPFQWTVGVDSAAGELAGPARSPEDLETGGIQANILEGDGLGIKIGPPKPGALRTGFLVLDGQPLNTPTRKSVLRKPIWGYRFWRAGHDTDVRACEIEHGDGAHRRILPGCAVRARPKGGQRLHHVGDSASALLLDQHVNRPGHVPKTLVTAIKSFGKKDPASWTSADERKVLADLHHGTRAKTSMTNSTKRANSIEESGSRGDEGFRG